ncbi:MAG TPA: PIN domain-containing protein [Polyangiaceae bacterium]
MNRRVLLDTGFLVALANALDPDHAACVAIWSETRAQLFSVDGVLVEAAHVLRRERAGPAAAIHIALAAGTELVPVSEQRAERALALMQKYRDVPMDFVDALLVVVAEERNVREVFTLDRRGFGVYRAKGRERFRIFP